MKNTKSDGEILKNALKHCNSDVKAIAKNRAFLRAFECIKCEFYPDSNSYYMKNEIIKKEDPSNGLLSYIGFLNNVFIEAQTLQMKSIKNQIDELKKQQNSLRKTECFLKSILTQDISVKSHFIDALSLKNSKLGTRSSFLKLAQQSHYFVSELSNELSVFLKDPKRISKGILEKNSFLKSNGFKSKRESYFIIRVATGNLGLFKKAYVNSVADFASAFFQNEISYEAARKVLKNKKLSQIYNY